MNPPDWLDGWGALLIILALAILNLWQFYKYHDVKGRLAHIFEHGHAPIGAVVVPVERVIVPDAVVEAARAREDFRAKFNADLAALRRKETP